MDSVSGLTVDTSQVMLDAIYNHKAGSFYVEYSMWVDEAEQIFEAADELLISYRFDFC
ncbi:hypothetical protein I6E78_01975 [Pseudoalteromonas sp. NZS127]|uniref:Uncharacterized protein n=1 Tax=Pseudoalteromonas translucida KMM 520 TaxID=1315283 RepID=A0A0U2LLT9_9GAMM|nr:MULTISPECIES: hypothetical protein [Pseudoalteromonas]ALS32486.1 hypothetical protein PTRA_a1241 [Pseudoalteromonas translucida KMM 520]MBH0070778.1 hypothetical protein [Pseudoalteromonas sp. NZS127]MBO7927501.1 hypothetical protein [Pseudoalteromonas sp. K222D]|tara:strand:- start:84 stop:257 length:174 start_codon:yes stop_codon:yes gene_type:complete